MLSLIAFVALRPPLDLKPFAVVKHAALSEISGIDQSAPGKDQFWVHNDSGDSARIFAIKRDGSVLSPAAVRDYKGIRIEGAKNVDWEDIAVDGGKVYIGDLGNNGNARKDLGIYVVPEPDPLKDTSVKPLQFLPVRYPDQTSFPPPKRHFDCESIFVFHGKVHALTKHRMPLGPLPENGTKLYRLDTSFTDTPNVLKKLDERQDMKGWVTGADTSPDGRWLAVLTHFPRASIWIFDTDGVGDKLLSKPVRWVEIFNAKQCEAICFDGSDTLIVANEQRDIFRIPIAQVPKR